MNSFDSIAASCEDRIREQPLQSAGLGVVAGFVLSRLPVFGLVGLVVRIAFLLLRPTLLVLGGAKAWDLIQARRGEASRAIGEDL